MAKKSFGEKIKERRKELGLKAVELAKMAGIDKTYLSKIENHNYLPSSFTERKLSNALKINLQNLFLKEKFAVTFGKTVKFSTSMQKDEILVELYEHIMNDVGSHHGKFVSKFLAIYNPQKAKDKHFVDSLTKFIIKWRRRKIEFWDAYHGESDKFIKEIMQG